MGVCEHSKQNENSAKPRLSAVPISHARVSIYIIYYNLIIYFERKCEKSIEKTGVSWYNYSDIFFAFWHLNF
jgi:hypothetical protein